MSFLNYLFDSEYSQRSDIERLKERDRVRSSNLARTNMRRMNKTRAAELRIEELETEVALLEDQRGEMALYLKALLAVLLEKKAISPQEIYEKMHAIDIADGVEDGKTKL